jgi:hypothetical protein
MCYWKSVRLDAGSIKYQPDKEYVTREATAEIR